MSDPEPASGAARKPRPVRRVPRPRTSGILDSPVRNLMLGVLYTLTVMLAATAAYVAQGWSIRDAGYMVIVTVFTVGYNEVRPIDTAALSAITIGLIVFGCTGIIFLTGALVQFFTLNQINNTARQKRMSRQIDQLEGHVVVCGFGFLGAELARALSASSAGLVILEDDESRSAEAKALGYLCIRADASSESALLAAGVTRANALASVLSNDALNVFITLSARSGIGAIAGRRGEFAGLRADFEQLRHRRNSDRVIAPAPAAVLGPGDAVVLFGRPSRSPGIMPLFEPRTRTNARG